MDDDLAARRQSSCLHKIITCLRNSGAQYEIQMKYQRRRCSVRWEQRDVDKNLFREIFEHILPKKKKKEQAKE